MSIKRAISVLVLFLFLSTGSGLYSYIECSMEKENCCCCDDNNGAAVYKNIKGSCECSISNAVKEVAEKQEALIPKIDSPDVLAFPYAHQAPASYSTHQSSIFYSDLSYIREDIYLINSNFRI